ncbi:MAG: FtsX-like permease family protein, partial [Oscillospiraceae bacterium]
LGTVAGVSLVVAALFIINTMLMSVYERTREIGIMKVVGCTVSDIRKNFLIEAGLIGFLGGVIGVLTSYLLAFCSTIWGLTLEWA